MPRSKILLGLVLIVGVAALAAFLIIRPDTGLLDAPPPRAESLTMHGYDDNGDLLWTANAASGELVDGEGAMHEIIMTFLPEQSGSLTATGERLTYGETGGRLSHGVRIDREDGLSLATEGLWWDDTRQTIECSPVIVQHEGSELEAGRLRYRMDEETGIFEEGVQLLRPEEPAVVAVSRSARLQTDSFVLADSVEITIDEESYTCDQLVVSLDLQRVELSGDVAAELAQGRVEADHIERTENGELTARGGVRVTFDLAKGDVADAP